MSDIIDQWRIVADTFGARLRDVGPDQWDAPTPCTDFTVRQLVDHAVDVQRTMPKAVGAGDAVDTPLGDDPASAWTTIVAAGEEALRAEGVLDMVVPGPMGERPVGQSMGIPTMDLLVHTWDLARAIGADETLPADMVAHAYEQLQPMDAMLRDPQVFGPKVEVPDDADLQTRFIAFTGRQP